MSTFKVEVVPVKLLPHPHADSLSIVKVFGENGYTVVVKTADWQGVDRGAYIPPDSVVPDAPEYAFLGERDKDRRVTVRRFRDVYSEGLLMPAPAGAAIGEDVAARMGVTHYEPPATTDTTGDAETPPLGVRPVYDLEHHKRYGNLLRPGEDVVISEKLHGCLPYAGTICMADGSRRRISDVRVGDEVLGVDATGRVVSTPVRNVFNNGRADRWLRVKATRNGAGRGSHYSAVVCTPNHEFFNPETGTYTRADELRPGDSVLGIRSEACLPPLQRSAILGKLLGDGHLHQTAWSAALEWSHRQKDSEYVEWTARALGPLATEARAYQTSGYGTAMVRAQSVFSGQIKAAFAGMYQNGVKGVPPWVADAIDPLTLAFWYMDDGPLGHGDDQEDRANFAVCSFTREDCHVLIQAFARFGITATYYEANGNSRLRLNSDDAERFFLLIAPYIPPSMQRKLPVRYRGHAGWLPRADAPSYKDLSVRQTITSIEEATDVRSMRFDIETGTHNYFANGVLTHNSNARFCFQNGRMYAGSRREWKRESSSNLWWRALRQYPQIEALCRDHPNLTLYGEIYGDVQDLKYGHKRGEVSFAAFDLYSGVTGERGGVRRLLDRLAAALGYQRSERDSGFVTFDAAFDLCAAYNVPWVPILYRGPYDPESLPRYVDGHSVIPSSNNLREGCVIRPVNERNDPAIGRVHLKLVSGAYLSRSPFVKEWVAA